MPRHFESYPRTILTADTLLYEMVNAWSAYKVARQRLAEDFSHTAQDTLADASATFYATVRAWRAQIRLLQQSGHLGVGSLRKLRNEPPRGA